MLLAYEKLKLLHPVGANIVVSSQVTVAPRTLSWVVALAGVEVIELKVSEITIEPMKDVSFFPVSILICAPAFFIHCI